MIREACIEDWTPDELESTLGRKQRIVIYFVFPRPQNLDEHGRPKWEHSCSISLVEGDIEYVVEGHGIGRNRKILR